MPVTSNHLSAPQARTWAKRIQRSLGEQGHRVSLGACQAALAHAMGCSSWPALVSHLETAPSAAPAWATPTVLQDAFGPTLRADLMDSSHREIGVLRMLWNDLVRHTANLGDMLWEYRGENQPVRIRVRIHGQLQDQGWMDPGLAHALIMMQHPRSGDGRQFTPGQRIEQPLHLAPEDIEAPEEGPFFYTMRGSLLPVFPKGWDLTWRRRRGTHDIAITPGELGMSSATQARLKQASQEAGLIVVAGTTGSGKTTTARAIAHAHGLRFLDAAIPTDQEQIEALCKANETVVVPVHAAGAFGALQRLQDLLSPKALGQVQLVLQQRLTPVLCAQCAVPIAEGTDGQGWTRTSASRDQGPGCAHCGGLGITGRSVVESLVEITPEIQTALVNGTLDHVNALSMGVRDDHLRQKVQDWVNQGRVGLAQAIAQFGPMQPR